MRFLLTFFLISTLAACAGNPLKTENICDHVLRVEVEVYCHIGQEVNNVLGAANRAYRAGEISKTDHAKVVKMVKEVHPMLVTAETILNTGGNADAQLAIVKALLLKVK